MESWRRVWRQGFVPKLSGKCLQALRDGLARDDCRIMQGATSSPPPLECVMDWPCEGACAIGYAGWHGKNLETVGEVEEFFAMMCFEADQLLGEPAACRHFLNWWDDTPRGTAVLALLAEVDLAIAELHSATVFGPALLGMNSPPPVRVPPFVLLSRESIEIADSYDGERPDCGEAVPVDVVDGGDCSNCGHVFCLPSSIDAETQID